MLLLIIELYPSQKHHLQVIHFNHGLRGAESDEDEHFVNCIADELGLEFQSTKVHGLAGSNEAKLRSARLAYFHRKMDEADASILLQGHQLDDVAETLLMRLSRGSSTSGLAAPRSVQWIESKKKYHVRPLLSVSRDTIHSALQSAGIRWREDASNQSSEYFRNRIRHQLIPVWKSLAPQELLPAVAQSRQLMEEDDEALQQWAIDVLESLTTRDHQILKFPPELPKAILRRLLYLWIHKNDIPSSCLIPSTMDSVLTALENQRSTRLTLTPEIQLVLNADHHQIQLSRKIDRCIKSWPVTHLAPSTTLFLPDGHRLFWQFISISESWFADLKAGKVDDRRTAWLELPDGLQNSKKLLIRQRRPGDLYQPLGMMSPMKLQNLLVNKKIPAEKRDLLPIVSTLDDEILWCPGCPAPELFKIRKPSRSALQIFYL